MNLTQEQFAAFRYADVVNDQVLLYGDDASYPMVRADLKSVSDLEVLLKRPLIVCKEEGAMSLHTVEDLIELIVETLGEDSYAESIDHIDQMAIKLDQTHAEIYELILADFRRWLEDNPIWLQSNITMANLAALELHSKPPKWACP